MLTGQKHIIKCRCFLQQFKRHADPPLHRFVVFSVLDDDVVKPKLVQCNNCGLVHKVTELGRSEIMLTKEHSAAIVTIDDLKSSLPTALVGLLESAMSDLPTWEHVQFIYENKRWGEFVVIATERVGKEQHGKYVRLLGENLFKVETFIREDSVQ